MEVTAPVTNYVPGDFFSSNYWTVSNSGNITVLSSPTELFALDIGTVVLNDIFMAWLLINFGNKDVTGRIQCYLQTKSGTATWLGNGFHTVPGMTFQTLPDGDNHTFCFPLQIVVTGSGTLEIKVVATSNAGNSTVNADSSGFSIIKIIGA